MPSDQSPASQDPRTVDEWLAQLPHELSDLLSRARNAANEACTLLMNRPATLHVEAKSTPTDSVTDMDKRSEALLVRLLLDGRDDAIFGEEGSNREGTSGYTWIIDPIDGTVNYLYGLPGWSVSIALHFNGEPLLGVVAVPTYAMTFFGIAGHGSYREQFGTISRLHCGRVDQLAMALTATGFGYAASRRAAQAKVVAPLLPELRDIRRMGSAAVDICFVAGGQLDAFYEKGLNPWDFAAAQVVAQEAGVTLAGIDGRGPNTDLTIAANPVLFALLHNRLRDLAAHLPA